MKNFYEVGGGGDGTTSALCKNRAKNIFYEVGRLNVKGWGEIPHPL
jgi:hypothetical protein